MNSFFTLIGFILLFLIFHYSSEVIVWITELNPLFTFIFWLIICLCFVSYLGKVVQDSKGSQQGRRVLDQMYGISWGALGSYALLSKNLNQWLFWAIAITLLFIGNILDAHLKKYGINSPTQLPH